MKKALSISLSLLLTLCLVFAFAGCEDDKKDPNAALQSAVSDIVSDANQIQTPAISAPSVETSSVEEVQSIIGTWKGDIEVSEGEKLPITCEFKADGTFFMGFLETDLKENLKEMLEATAEDMGMTLDEIVESMDMTLDEYIEQSMETYEDATIEGNYKEENGKLYLTESLSETDFTEGVEYELSGNTLTIEMDGETLTLTKA